MKKVLIADPVAKEGIETLRAAGLEVDAAKSLPLDELKERIAEAEGLIVRSETKVTAEILDAAKQLRVIGRAGVGVDNIDVSAATQRGIVVLNSPEGNTIAACEHTWSLLLALARNVPDAVASLRAGEWKRSQFVGVELYSKTIGIIGLGKIGREVAKRARAFEMRVIAYDPFITRQQADRLGVEIDELDPLLERADFITLHMPLTKDTQRLLCKERFEKMKPTAYLINAARGGLICEDDLVEALNAGKLAGAALDVFKEEPLPPESPLIACPRLILTPHLGASTREAQIGVAVDVAEQIVDVLDGKPARSAVNMPFIPSEVLSVIEPYIQLAEKVGRLQVQRAEGRVESVDVVYAGDLAEHEIGPITRSLLKGLLEPMLGSGTVTFVNAPLLAEQRGIKVTESKTPISEDYASLIRVTVQTDKGRHIVSGTLFGKRDIRIIEIDGYRVDVEPQGYALMSRHIDKPGIVGRVGSLLGENGINIAGMHVGRAGRGEEAVMILNVDNPVPPELVAQVAEQEGMINAKLVEF
ncbi:MAG: phosphoglycerate dehydrogenase [Armatimonadetes bacterium]|nr:phosphoglycerate dehydrogenase [Armatimonadota bacterium]